MKFFNHRNFDLNRIMKEDPEIRDLILEHKEVFAVHNHEDEECWDCDCCDKCSKDFPRKGHLHPDCIRCIPEGLSKHICETTQTLYQSFTGTSYSDKRYLSDEKITPEEKMAYIKRLCKTRINQALINLGIEESAVVAPIHPIISLEDNKDLRIKKEVSLQVSESVMSQNTKEAQEKVVPVQENVVPIHPITSLEDNKDLGKVSPTSSDYAVLNTVSQSVIPAHKMNIPVEKVSLKLPNSIVSEYNNVSLKMSESMINLPNTEEEINYNIISNRANPSLPGIKINVPDSDEDLEFDEKIESLRIWSLVDEDLSFIAVSYTHLTLPTILLV